MPTITYENKNYSRQPDGYYLHRKHAGDKCIHREYLHRATFENELGVNVESDEIVHHIDFDTENNELDNLMLLSRKNHVGLHSYHDEGMQIKRGKPCTECGKPSLNRFLCSLHYHRWLRHGEDRPKCSVEGCNNNHGSKGLCDTHYAQVRRAHDKH